MRPCLSIYIQVMLVSRKEKQVLQLGSIVYHQQYLWRTNCFFDVYNNYRQRKSEKEREKMPAVWFALKRSLHCKSEPSDVHDPRVDGSLSNIITRKTGRSGCSRSMANLKDVIHGNKTYIEKPTICSPRSIGSSELLHPITHEVVLSNSNCELKITGVTSLQEGISTGGNGNGISTFVGTVKPGTPMLLPPGNSVSLLKKTPSSLSRRCTPGRFSAVYSKPRASFGTDSHVSGPLSCHKCAEQFSNWETIEQHHPSNHAVTELVEGDSSRKIVEMICRTSWAKSDSNSGGIERILKVHNMQKTQAQFEEYREIVKIKASKLPKKHPRCLADGNELLRFFGATVECNLGINGSSIFCSSEKCSVCQILIFGFSSMKEFNGAGVGVFTTSTSGRAIESIKLHDDCNRFLRKALIVCRVIAGRVHRPLENIQELAGQSGFDSLAGKMGVYSNIEELHLLSPRALLPCFVVICKSG